MHSRILGNSEREFVHWFLTALQCIVPKSANESKAERTDFFFFRRQDIKSIWFIEKSENLIHSCKQEI